MFSSKQFTVCTLVTAMFGFSQLSHAHTVLNKAVDEDSSNYDTAFVITHGCGADASGTPAKVTGQSAVFPYGALGSGVKAWHIDGAGTKTEITDPAQLGSLIDGGEDLVSVEPASIGQNYPFKTIEEEYDPVATGAHSAPIVRAINWREGDGLPTKVNNGKTYFNYGLTQFAVHGPGILDECVGALQVRIAVANWCSTKATNATEDKNNVRADWWFATDSGSTKFTDPDLIQTSFWTTLSVKNTDAAADPASCPGGDLGTVIVQPSGSAIDEYLPHPKFTKGNSNL